jgi:hypothetical protein
MLALQARSALLRSMEQSLGSYLGLYKELLADCKESHTVTQLCHYLTHMAGVGHWLQAAILEGRLRPELSLPVHARPPTPAHTHALYQTAL